MATKKNKIGRPSKYSQELVNEICRRIAEGESLRQICRDNDMPSAETVRVWLLEKEEFSAQYARAREAQADLLAEQTVEIADDPKSGVDAVSVAHARLRIDARKWYAGKVAPKKYGDKVTQDVHHSGLIGTHETTKEEYLQAREEILKEF